jgi:hypothetical protein
MWSIDKTITAPALTRQGYGRNEFPQAQATEVTEQRSKIQSAHHDCAQFTEFSTFK